MDKKKKIIALIAVFLIAVVIGLIIAFFAGKGQRSHVVFKGDSSKVNLKQDREDTYSIGVSTSIADNHPYSHDDEAAAVLKKLVYEPLIILTVITKLLTAMQNLLPSTKKAGKP